MAYLTPLSVNSMFGDVAMMFAYENVDHELDHYIVTRVRDKLPDLGLALHEVLDTDEYERARTLIHDELLRSVSHKRREATVSSNAELSAACDAATRAITSWAAMG